MVETYREILVILCIGLLGWGIVRVERIYQYPFFMGSIFLSFVLPQAFALVDNPGPVSQEALERVLLVSCLCASACLIGYVTPPNTRWLRKLNINIDERKVYRAGIVLMCQGYFFNFLLSRTTIQKSQNMGGNWTGPATIYVFLAQVIYIAFAIFILQTLKRPKFINILCTAISGWPILQTVLAGRRQPTMTVALIIGLSLWLVWRCIPPRWLVITAVLLLTLIIPVLGQLRSGFWNLVFSGQWQEVISATQEAFQTQQDGEILELRNAALLMDAAERTGLYGYGTGWWDAIVFQYVPGQIVGYDFKESLQFKLLRFELLGDIYGYKIPSGSTNTGIGECYMEFGYFGFLAFAFIGYVFKNLWISSVYYKSTISRLLYMGLISPAMIGITHGLGRFFQEALFQAIFISLLAYYSRVKYNQCYSDTTSFEVR